MTTSIFISGQISGNFTLRNQLVGESIEEKRTMFNGFKLVFKTKKEAVAAIRKAYNSMVADEPASKGTLGGIRVNKDRTALYYDASKAVIEFNY